MAAAAPVRRSVSCVVMSPHKCEGHAGSAVHRSMLRYTKQNFRTPDTRESVLVQRMMDECVVLIPCLMSNIIN